MAENLTLSDHHSEMIGSYLKFAKFCRGKHVRAVTQTFDQMKMSRLLEGAFSAEEVCELLDELCVLVKGDLEAELMSTAHTAALLLCQMCCQAQLWHLKLNADVSELENRDMLETVNKFEERIGIEKVFSGSPLKMNKLQPLSENTGPMQLLQVEIDRLNAENKRLCDKLREIEKQSIEVIEVKATLVRNLEEVKKERDELKDRKTVNVENDLKYLEDEMSKVKRELETTMSESASTQQNLECDLEETKQHLLEIQSQLKLAEKELELKINQTAAFKNMKQMLASKNELVKSLRQRLSKYEDTPDGD